MKSNETYHNPQGGKGSKRRPTDEKAFAENYDKIFGERKPWYEKEDRFKKEKVDNK